MIAALEEPQCTGSQSQHPAKRLDGCDHIDRSTRPISIAIAILALTSLEISMTASILFVFGITNPIIIWSRDVEWRTNLWFIKGYSWNDRTLTDAEDTFKLGWDGNKGPIGT
jgi:hypothetical protein